MEWDVIAPMIVSVAVTSPDPLTVATEALLLVQVTPAPAITWPFWSRTSAVNCSVAPKAVSWAVAGVTVTVVGRGGSGGGVGGSVAPSPQAYAHKGGRQRRCHNDEDSMVAHALIQGRKGGIGAIRPRIQAAHQLD